MKVSEFIKKFDKYNKSINIKKLPKNIKPYFKNAKMGAKLIKFFYKFKSKDNEIPPQLLVKATKVLCFMKTVAEKQKNKEPLILEDIKKECGFE